MSIEDDLPSRVVSLASHTFTNLCVILSPNLLICLGLRQLKRLWKRQKFCLFGCTAPVSFGLVWEKHNSSIWACYASVHLWHRLHNSRERDEKRKFRRYRQKGNAKRTDFLVPGSSVWSSFFTHGIQWHYVLKYIFKSQLNTEEVVKHFISTR